jgi:hypothetical protein
MKMMKVNYHLAHAMNGVAGKTDKPNKRAMPILILLILVLSLIPLMPVMAISQPILFNLRLGMYNEGGKGDTISVTSPTIFDVTPGATVCVCWDAIKAWDGEKGLLNSTVAEASGEYEVWFDVPEAVAGIHYVWVKDMDAIDIAARSFNVLAKIKVSPSSGLEDDLFTIKGFGFDDFNDVALLMSDAPVLPDGINFAGEVGVPTSGIDGVQTEYEFHLDNSPLEPGSAVVTDGTETFADDGDGTLTGDLGGFGTVNYVNGVVSLDFTIAPDGYTAITADYECYMDVQNAVYVFTTTVFSDYLGSFVESVKVPDEQTEMARGLYFVHGYDGKGNMDSDDFTIGPVIALDFEEGPVGSVVEIRGRGFTEGVIITTGMVTIDDTECFVTVEDTASSGAFIIEAMIPSVPSKDEYDIVVDDGIWIAEAEFEVIGLPEIVVDPDYGLPGSTVNVYGENFTQIFGEKVSLELWDEARTVKIFDIDEYETDSSGEFSGVFTVPALSPGVYTIMARQEGHGATNDYNIHGDTSFMIMGGPMIVLLSPTAGPTGTIVQLTGVGFTSDERWNATFDGIVIVEDGYVDDEGTLNLYGAIPYFFVPTVSTGTHTVTVCDIYTEIRVEAEFEVTDTTTVILTPGMAPNEFNVTVEGSFFSAEEGTDLEFVLWNATDEWIVDVWHGSRFSTHVETEADGSFVGWWMVPDETVLSLGDYTINVTDDNDLHAQCTFSVVIAPSVLVFTDKDLYRPGAIVGVGIILVNPHEISFPSSRLTLDIVWPSGDGMTIYDSGEFTVPPEFSKFLQGWLHIQDSVFVPDGDCGFSASLHCGGYIESMTAWFEVRRNARTRIELFEVR